MDIHHHTGRVSSLEVETILLSVENASPVNCAVWT